ncbi:DNA replication and repair protein RecO [Saccharicrinis carchari]|uniref:DNA repair protein RecO n=1 Tax=Saccharicrinis carchari TaxID=1168039 RepID=A0A521CJ45_SACCC|nr:DNA repair protein RecO [Saccharicrinis carchari]SMO59466.1 DNA replication and repair protein RecO [Saccharicrinis carchari]
MIESTRGIVLTNTRYAETSVISQVYTEKLGLQSYIVNGARSRKSRGKGIFMQPLALLDLEVYHSEKKSVHRIKDFRANPPLTQIPFEPVRRSLAFFIAEVLSKALRLEDKRDDALFDFLHQSICVLDNELPGLQNFHLFMLFRLTRPLGFYPHFTSNEGLKYFDLRTGMFCHTEPAYPDYLNTFETAILLQLQNTGIEQLDTIKMNSAQRNGLIQKILLYFHWHISGFSKIKSFEVLKEIFR